MAQEQIHEITKEMAIGNILAEHPEKVHLLSEIMLDFGIHCVGCGAATFETLEQGVLGHGFSEEELNKLVVELNKAIKEKGKKKSVKEVENFSLKLSERAANKIKEIMKNERKEEGILRVTVLAGGCSGYTYDLEIVEKTPKGDHHMWQNGVKIAVDAESMEFLNEAEIDFIDTLKESGFKFINPNSSKECGCGKSFA